jgi:hypothetical protein
VRAISLAEKSFLSGLAVLVILAFSIFPLLVSAYLALSRFQLPLRPLESRLEDGRILFDQFAPAGVFSLCLTFRGPARLLMTCLSAGYFALNERLLYFKVVVSRQRAHAI